MNLTENQIEELKRRKTIKIIYATECQTCGFDFVWSGNYIVNDIEYPIITNHISHEGIEDWTEDHMCPNCLLSYRYDNGA